MSIVDKFQNIQIKRKKERKKRKITFHHSDDIPIKAVLFNLLNFSSVSTYPNILICKNVKSISQIVILFSVGFCSLLFST